MSEPVILISGANGEIGHGLIHALVNLPEAPAILALDLNPLSASLQPQVKFSVQGDILDARLLARLHEQYHIETVFHWPPSFPAKQNASPKPPTVSTSKAL